MCLYTPRDDISKSKSDTTLGAKDWSKSLSSFIILESSLSKLLASFQGLCLYHSIMRQWQMKHLGSVFGDLHIFGYFLSPLSDKPSEQMNADAVLN